MKISVDSRPILPALYLVLFFSLPAPAQEASQVLRNPSVNHALNFGISPPIRDLPNQLAPQYGFHLAPPVLRPKLQRLMELARHPQAVHDAALQRELGPLVSASIGLNLLGVGNGFDNYHVPDAPTDVNLAVGDTQVVQWVNVSFAIFDKTTGKVLKGPTLGNQWFIGLGPSDPCVQNNDGDIIAQWDKAAHRWLMTQNVFNGPPFYTCVAISQTNDATGSFFAFRFPQSRGFPDYPKWGIWSDAYYQSQNIFNPGFTGVNACAYERAKLLVGDNSAKQICFFDNSNGTLFDDSMLPADLDSAIPPPKGAPEVYVGSIDNANPNNKLYEYLFHVDFTNPGNSTFTGVNGSMPITVSQFSLACGGFGACVPQKGVSDVLDSLGDRLMYRLAYRNFISAVPPATISQNDHQVWLVSHAVVSDSGQVGERWYEFRAPENSTILKPFQQGTYAPDSNYRWMGSIAMDKAGDIALGYSISGSNMFPSINFTGRTPSDPPNTLETEATIVNGTGSQVDTANRWGDYTSMALDAQDGCTFWYTNQFYMVTTSFDWSTQLASIKFPNCR